MPPTPLTEDQEHAALVRRCVEGDSAAWGDLVRLHNRRVYNICYRFTGSDHEAQDLTQDVFLRVFRSLKSFRAGEGSFAVWLSRLAVVKSQASCRSARSTPARASSSKIRA